EKDNVLKEKLEKKKEELIETEKQNLLREEAKAKWEEIPSDEKKKQIDEVLNNQEIKNAIIDKYKKEQVFPQAENEVIEAKLREENFPLDKFYKIVYRNVSEDNLTESLNSALNSMLAEAVLPTLGSYLTGKLGLGLVFSNPKWEDYINGVFSNPETSLSNTIQQWQQTTKMTQSR
ncbi:MAG: hypothetical protein ACK4J0_00215, partial [Candidatus Anstonellaceae archaeon]